MVGLTEGFQRGKYRDFDLWNALSVDIHTYITWSILKSQFRKVSLACHPDSFIFRAVGGPPPGTSFTLLSNLRDDLEKEDEIKRDGLLRGAYERRAFRHVRTWRYESHKARAIPAGNSCTTENQSGDHSKSRAQTTALFDKVLRTKKSLDGNYVSSPFSQFSAGRPSAPPSRPQNKSYIFERKGSTKTPLSFSESASEAQSSHHSSAHQSGGQGRLGSRSALSSSSSAAPTAVEPSSQPSAYSSRVNDAKSVRSGPLTAKESGREKASNTPHDRCKPQPAQQRPYALPPEFSDHASRSRPYRWAKSNGAVLQESGDSVYTDGRRNTGGMQPGGTGLDNSGSRKRSSDGNAGYNRRFEQHGHTLACVSRCQTSESFLTSAHKVDLGPIRPNDRVQQNSSQHMGGSTFVHQSSKTPEPSEPEEQVRTSSGKRRRFLSPDDSELSRRCPSYPSVPVHRQKQSANAQKSAGDGSRDAPICLESDDESNTSDPCGSRRARRRSENPVSLVPRRNQYQTLLTDGENEEPIDSLSSRFNRLSSNSAPPVQRLMQASSTTPLNVLPGSADDSSQLSLPLYPDRGNAGPHPPGTFRYTIPIQRLLHLSRTCPTNTVKHMIMAVVCSRLQAQDRAYPEYIVMGSVPVLTRNTAMSFRVHSVDVEGRSLPTWSSNVNNSIRLQDIDQLGYWLSPFDAMTPSQRKAFLVGLRDGGRVLPEGF